MGWLNHSVGGICIRSILNSEREHFQSFLDALSQKLDSEIALIQLDQAGAHQALALKWQEFLIPVLQPAHSPELNPTERLWEFLKAQLRGEHFADLNQLRSRLQQLFEELSPQQVASLTSYDFILEALFYAAF